MKNLLFSCLLILNIESYAQITLDFQTQCWSLQQVKLSDSETKYLDFDPPNNQFDLYNLDGSLYKTILLPAPPGPNADIGYIFHLSRTLFDNDPSNIEYLVEYQYDSAPPIYYYYKTRIIREDGVIIFDEMNAAYNNIYSTEDGTKLMLQYYFANGYWITKKVFSLPGILPTSNQETNNLCNFPLNIYPNPNNGSFFIQLHSNEGKLNTIDLYSKNGKLLNTYTSSNNLLQINNMDLSEGMYFLNNRAGIRNSAKRMIIKK